MEYAKYECILKRSMVRDDVEEYKVSTSDIAAEFLRKFTDLESFPEEHMYALYMNHGHKIVGYTEVSIGGRACAYVELSAIFRNAILLCADCVILAHNHPSGDPTPSDEDKSLTKRVFDAGEVIGIQVLDHLIIGDRCHYSFLEAGEIPITVKH